MFGTNTLEFAFLVVLFFVSLAGIILIVQGISLAIDWFINFWSSDE